MKAMKRKQLLPNFNFLVLLFVTIVFLLSLIEIQSPYTFSQSSTNPESNIVRNFSSVITPSSTGEIQESFEANTNSILVNPTSSKIIQLSTVATYTETSANITSSEIPIYGKANDNDSIPTSNVVIPKQTLLNGTW